MKTFRMHHIAQECTTEKIDCEKRKYYHLQKMRKNHIVNKNPVIFAKVEFCDNDNKYFKVRDHSHYRGKCRGTQHSISNLRYKTRKEIPVVLHNGSNYNGHLIMKELTEEIKGQY